LRAADADHGDVGAEPARRVGDDSSEILLGRVDGDGGSELGGHLPA
jgi:hypothetical protein